MQNPVFAYTDLGNGESALPGITIVVFDTTPTDIEPGKPVCLHRNGDYTDRFGYVLCNECHMSLAWSRFFVREGLYADDTRSWANGVERTLLNELIHGPKVVTELHAQIIADHYPHIVPA